MQLSVVEYKRLFALPVNGFFLRNRVVQLGQTTMNRYPSTTNNMDSLNHSSEGRFIDVEYNSVTFLVKMTSSKYFLWPMCVKMKPTEFYSTFSLLYERTRSKVRYKDSINNSIQSLGSWLSAEQRRPSMLLPISDFLKKKKVTSSKADECVCVYNNAINLLDRLRHKICFIVLKP
jgi:hypothetical protein